MRKLTLIAAALLCVALLAVPAMASGPVRTYHETLRDGPARDGREFHPIVDFILTRPFGLACVAGGTALFVVLSPFNGLADLYVPGIPHLKESAGFLTMPMRYTFTDPLGSH